MSTFEVNVERSDFEQEILAAAEEMPTANAAHDIR
jgi:hypothetical protein